MSRTILLLWFLPNAFYCREFWSPDLPEVSPENLSTAKNYTTLQIRGLNNTSDLPTLANLIELKIFESQLREIAPGTLCPPNLKILELDVVKNTNKYPLLTQDTFENCNNLEELLLDLNFEAPHLVIDKKALANLNLKNLKIRGWYFGRLQKDFLILNNATLTTLSFEHCDISSIDDDAFGNLRNLENLEILSSISGLPKQLFKSTPKLTHLNLAQNTLKNLTWDEFQGLTELKFLSLFSNELERFDAKKIAKHMPKLEEIELAVNPTPCKYQGNFFNLLKSKYNHYIKIWVMDFC